MASRRIYQVGMNVELTGVATNRGLRPYQPTLVEAEWSMNEGSKGVDVPVATNDPGAKQNSNEFVVFAVFGCVDTAARDETNT